MSFDSMDHHDLGPFELYHAFFFTFVLGKCPFVYVAPDECINVSRAEMTRLA